MTKLLVTLACILAFSTGHATTYTKADSLKVVELLKKGAREKSGTVTALWYAEKLKGTPYVAQTLEVNPAEQLVVNLRQLDCTTLVETAVALYLTTKNGKTGFWDFCKNLEKIRYNGGKRNGYESRNHYFSQWIDSNTKLGICKEITSNSASWTATQKLDLHFMSSHANLYPMLHDTTKIRQLEKASSGRIVRYIPKSLVGGTKQQLKDVHTGDILAIITKKDGLDTSHLGFAVWGKDKKLHLLNASQIHKKVVLEKMTLYKYMQQHPSQIGLRVVRIL